MMAWLAWSGRRDMTSGMASPIAVAELDHVVLRCRDQERMLAFYTQVLGLAEERRLDGIGLVQLRAGRSMVDLVPGQPGSFESANVDHVCLMLAPVSMDAVVQYLSAHGIDVIGEPTTRYGATGNGPSVYVRDPEGNVIELKVPGDAA